MKQKNLVTMDHQFRTVKSKSNIWIFYLLCFLIICFGFLSTNSVYASPLLDDSIERVADPNTMDSYIEAMLGGYDATQNNGSTIINNYGSRFAGEMWADKTVTAHDGSDSTNSLSLDMYTDGIDTDIEFNEDFLHTFSVLGSSRQVIGETPIDLVMVLDVSGSMGDYTNRDSKIYRSITAMNNAINTLMLLNKDNRVAVVLFASHPATLMALDHYEVTDGNYINVLECKEYNSSQHYYSYTIEGIGKNAPNTTVKTQSGNGSDNNPSEIGSNTNLDSGLWMGLNILANEEDTTANINNITISRQPVFIVVGDGDPQFYQKQASPGEWWNPIAGSLYGVSGGVGNFNSPAVILSTIMRASYMKSAVINNYRKNLEDKGIKDTSSVNFGFFSIGVELGQIQNDYGESVASAILDPGNTYNKTNGGFNDKNTSNAGLNRNTSIQNEGAFGKWTTWEKGNDPVTISPFGVTPETTFNQLNGPTLKDVDKDQVIENINYVDKYYNAESAKNISSIFDELITQITTPAFTPIHGINASGIESSITYNDPIGAYMELKDITDMTLFGKRYKITKYGVYDHYVNDAIIINEGRENESSKIIRNGWYLNENTQYQNYNTYDYLGDNLNWYTPNNDSPWDYATYRISYVTAESMALSLPKDSNELREKENNTVFTFYKITSEENNPDASLENIINPCYKAGALNSSTTFNMNDIHIWVEDSGDYFDEYGSDNIPDGGFQQALYIDIPIEAIPLQVATITSTNNGENIKYDTNLSDWTESTPLRIFYTVGFNDEFINDKNQVDFGKIPQTYLNSHILVNDQPSDQGSETDSNIRRKVYFDSNYFSKNIYNDYPTEIRDYSQGNPSVTFSPGNDNSFYLFQETRPLFLIGGLEGKVDQRLEDIELNLNHKPTHVPILEAIKEELKNNSPYDNISLVDEVYEDEYGRVTITPDNWFYIVREYYELDDNGQVEIKYIAIARKGSEFGSAIGDAKIGKAEYLCWYDPDTKQEFNYDVNQKDRGKKQALEQLGNPAATLYVAARKGGLRVGGLLNHIGIKGQDIRSSVVNKYEEEFNPTDTATNYYLPTISTSTTNDNVVVNTFLGNNGRLAIDSTRVLVTKTVNNVNNVLSESLADEKFNFDIYIEGFEGNHEAIIVIRDEFDPSMWRRRFESIDLITSNRDLLQNADNTLATVDENGKRVGFIEDNEGKKQYYYYKDGELNEELNLEEPCSDVYHVYIGTNNVPTETGAGNLFRVFQANKEDPFQNDVERGGRTYYAGPEQIEGKQDSPNIHYKIANNEHPTGERGYWVDEVCLIPISHMNSAWNFDPNVYSQSPRIKEFEVASLFVTGDSESATELSSPFKIRSNFMTDESIYFNENNKATFTLDDGEGLLFYSIPTGSNYKVTESLTSEQASEGVYIQNVNHYENGISNILIPKAPERESAFSVSGVTNLNEDAAHYINYIPDVDKIELTPGADELVKIDDEVKYLIKWENYRFDSTTNTNQPAIVTVTDRLDIGVDFLTAKFDPDFGNIINKDYDPEEYLDQTNVEEKENHYDDPNTENNLVLNANEVPANKYGDYVLSQSYFDNQGNKLQKDITVYYSYYYSQNSASGIYTYFDAYDRIQSFKVDIDYDPIKHTVIWNIDSAPAATYGSLGITVQVNDKAKIEWNYSDSNNNGYDFKINNQARISVGSDFPEVLTKIVSNPTGEPTKTETNIERINPTPPVVIYSDQNSDLIDHNSFYSNLVPLDIDDGLGSGENTEYDIVPQIDVQDLDKLGILTGPLVEVEDKITYEIEFSNYKDEIANITIIDKLDPGVDFIKASFEDTILISAELDKSDDPDINPSESDNITATITYDSDSHTVTWVLQNCPALYNGKVELVVEVNNNAIKTWYPGDEQLGSDDDYMVYNRASVQVGNDSAIDTNIIENPVGDPKKAAIRISKIVTGDENDLEKEFHFTLKIYDDSINGNYGNLEFVDGIAEFTLKNGETKIAVDLPDNISYEVTEVDADQNGYTTIDLNKNTTGTLTKETLISVRFENHKDEPISVIEIPEPSKKELTPGDTKYVNVGDKITYDIYYENPTDETVDITIVDPLDIGVNFVSATKDLSKNIDYNVILLDDQSTLPDGIDTSLIDYNYDKYIQWSIGNVSPRSNGIVQLEVQVNDFATKDNIVKNIAFVKNGTGDFIKTEEPTNPLEPDEIPHKIELSPGDKEAVKVGDIIEYAIYYSNSSDVAKDVYIKDPIDVGLDFVEASDNGTYNNSEILDFDTSNLGYSYKGVVSWTLKDVKPNTINAYVTVKVKVTEEAIKKNSVHDKAFVKVGNKSWIETEDPQNPLEPEETPHKTELSPGDKEVVKVGDIIEYAIYYSNSSDVTKDVYIKDPIDVGLDFVEASDNGTYNSSEILDFDTSNLRYSYKGVVSWTLKDVKPNTINAYVTVKVKVTEEAIKKKSVHDKAFVKVGNGSWIETEDPQNPLEEPHKTELSPGNGVGVEVGEDITYQISYENNSTHVETITIIDPLDNGLTFKQASNNGTYYGDSTDLPSEITVDYTYNGYVKWTIENVAPGTTGTVTLIATVNDKAISIVKNQAFVSTNNSSFEETEEVENPLGGPHKTELTPGNGLEVEVSKTITYQISYVNNSSEVADITIKDPLDVGLTFISTSNNGTYDETETLSSNIGSVSYAYNGVVTWKLTNVQPGYEGTVNLTAQVNEKALNAQIVYNKAFVQVGNDNYQVTEQVENPLPGTHKIELTPGNGINVGIGDTITYQISYSNDTDNSVDVTIVDPIDTGVTFVSASNNGTYEKNTTLSSSIGKVDYQYNGIVTWKLTDVPAQTVGFVTVTVKVNGLAYLNDIIKDQAFVQIGNNSWIETEEPENPLIETPQVIIEKEQSSPEIDRTTESMQVEETNIVTYYLIVSNIGNNTATDVIITDEIPEGLIYVENSASDNGICINNVLTWTIAELEAGDSIEVSFKVQVPEADTEMSYINIASVNWNENLNRTQNSNSVEIKTVKEDIDDPEPDNPSSYNQKPNNQSSNVTTGNNANSSNNTTSTGSTRTTTTSSNNNGTTTTSVSSTSAKTGVNNNIWIWIVLIIIAIACLIGAYFYRRRRNER